MPLIKSASKEAFKKNVEKEMSAGKPQKQSLAIAYSVQRKNKKPKKMAEGGEVGETLGSRIGYPGAAKTAPKYAHGGMIPAGSEDDMEPRGMDMRKKNEAAEHYSSIADAILAKKRDHAQMLADGGMVDLNHESEEEPNQYNRLNMEAAKKEQYDDSQLEADPMDSNEHGDDIDGDEHDMISQIRRKMKSKRA